MANKRTSLAHSPGPWIVDLYYDSAGWPCYQLAEIHETKNQAMANACLIAAAPELLSVLRAISNDCDRWFNGSDDMSADDLFAAFQSAADKAITKALRMAR